jgi:hypothetical protein
MTEQDIQNLFNSAINITPRKIEYRAYYDKDGSIITYTTESIEGQYIEITSEQYAQARHDAKVIDNKLVFTHRRSHVSKLVENKTDGIRTSKYDVSVIQDDGDSTYYTIRAYEIKR